MSPDACPTCPGLNDWIYAITALIKNKYETGKKKITSVSLSV